MNPFAFSGILVILSSLYFGFVVFLRNPGEKLNQLWGFFSLAVAIWGLAAFRIGQIPEEQRALAVVWWRITYIGITAIPVLLYHFVYQWLGLQKKIMLFLFYAWGLFFIVLVWTPWADLFIGYDNMRLVFNSFYVVGPKPVFNFFVLSWYGIVFYGHLELFNAFKKAVGERKNQIKYFFLGMAVAFLGGGASFLMCYGVPMYPYLNFAVPLYPAIMAYAIVKYRLLDINLVIARAGIIGVIYTLVLGFPYWLGFKMLGKGDWVVPVTVMASLATLGPFLYQFFRRRAEAIILRTQHEYQSVLKEVSKTMTRIRDLDKLLKVIVLTVVNTVKVSFAAVYLKQDSGDCLELKYAFPNKSNRFPGTILLQEKIVKTLETLKKPVSTEELPELSALLSVSAPDGLFIPSFIENKLIGFMLLGPKQVKQVYSHEDIVVFETLSYATSLAIENCKFWQEVEDRQRKARLQEMDTYSYSLAHEIDNPMQIILGESELLKSECIEVVADEARRKEILTSFDYIIEAAQRVASMVKAIRDFGQKASGTLKPVSIESVIESFAQLYWPQCKTYSIALRKNVSLEHKFVNGEKPELMQVLVILANNAIHAMKFSEQKTIEIKASNRGNTHIVISFTDTGYGIKQSLLPVIFLPFTTTKASSEGTGMGLYNAKKIIEKHQGRIWAESDGENQGATFYIELPCSDGNDGQSEGIENEKRVY